MNFRTSWRDSLGFLRRIENTRGERGRRIRRFKLGVGIELEDRALLAAPSGIEQEMLEWINRFRQDPHGEYARLISGESPVSSPIAGVADAVAYFKVNLATLKSELGSLTAAAPLAWNNALGDSATGHSQKMIQADMQEHELPGEQSLGDRISAAGYQGWSNLGENIFAYGDTVPQSHAGFVIDWGGGPPSGMQAGRGHRVNLMSSDFSEIGISILNDNSASTNVGPLVITEDFGSRYTVSQPFVLGVVYNDASQNDFYNAGEGLAGATVKVQGAAGTFTTTTTASGGYQMNVPTGTYTITFSGGALSAPVVKNLQVGSVNVKVDLKQGDTGPPPSSQLQFAASSVTTSVVEGGQVELTITRLGDSSGTADVKLAFAASGTARKTDVQALANGGMVHFDPGQTSRKVLVTTIDDTAPEPSETVILVLTSPVGATIIAPTYATVTITDNDAVSTTPQLQFAANSVATSVVEGGQVELTITRLGDSSGTADVKLAFAASGTARKGDVQALANGGMVHFDPGQTTRKVLVKTINDTITEPSETVILVLTNAVGATIIAPTYAIVTITDNDAPGVIPRVTSVTPEITSAGLVSIAVDFNTGLDSSSATRPSAFALRAAGNDGKFRTADDLWLTISDRALDATGKRVTLTLDTAYTPHGPLQLVVSRGIKNTAGQALAGATIFAFTA